MPVQVASLFLQLFAYNLHSLFIQTQHCYIIASEIPRLLIPPHEELQMYKTFFWQMKVIIPALLIGYFFLSINNKYLTNSDA